MISPSGSFRIFLASEPIDFRKGVDGLVAHVANHFELDPVDSAIYVFRSRRADRLKLLVWDGTGLVLTMKRLNGGRFGDDDESRVKRRVKRLMECRKAASGLEHLKRDDRERLEVLKDGARLIAIRNEHHADELAAALHEDMPWMAPATEMVWHAMRRSVREGWPGLRMPPLLLDGPPGIVGFPQMDVEPVRT